MKTLHQHILEKLVLTNKSKIKASTGIIQLDPDDDWHGSFHGLKFDPSIGGFSKDGIISCTLPEMTELLGFEPEYDEDDDKMHFEWRCEAKGIKFNIYDWKVYEDDIEFYEENDIEWHIGTKTKEESKTITDFLNERLKKIKR